MIQLHLKSIDLTIGDRRRAFYIRPHSAGDNGVVRQTFAEQQYTLADGPHIQAVKNYVATAVQQGRTPLVLDFGANIGASAVLFALQYPQARIIALEPHPLNFAVLEFNTQGLPVTCINAAIAQTAGSLLLDDPGAGDWGYRTSNNAGEGSMPVTAVTPESVLAMCDSSHEPLLCKIDVEGAEEDLFAGSTDWASLFPMLVIELHDWMLPGKRSSRAFVQWLARNDVEVLQKGENLFCFNMARLASAIPRQ